MLKQYIYYPILDYLPLSETERKVYAMVLTFAGREGLTLSNAGIGQAVNRSEHTAKKAIASLRRKGLIKETGKQSKYRRIYPADPAAYLTALGGPVDKNLLDHFRILLDRYNSPLLDHSGRSREVKEINNKEDFSFSHAKTQPMRDIGPAPAEVEAEVRPRPDDPEWVKAHEKAKRGVAPRTHRDWQTGPVDPEVYNRALRLVGLDGLLPDMPVEKEAAQ